MIERHLTGKDYYRAGLAGLAAAGLAIAGCGSNDTGKANIHDCPSGYLVGAKKLTSVPSGQRALQEGVAELRSGVSARAKNQYVQGHDVNIRGIDPKFRGAALAIFNTAGSDPWLNIGSDTKVDDISEAFCHDPKNHDAAYFSPAGDAAIGALAAAGITVKIPAK